MGKRIVGSDGARRVEERARDAIVDRIDRIDRIRRAGLLVPPFAEIERAANMPNVGARFLHEAVA